MKSSKAKWCSLDI